jgi:hypothetical protein
MSDPPPPPDTPWYKNYKTLAAYAGLVTALCSGYVSVRNTRDKSSSVRVDNVYEQLLEANVALSRSLEKTQGQLYELRQYIDNRDEEIRKAVVEQRPPVEVPTPQVDKPKPVIRRAKKAASTAPPSPPVAVSVTASSAPPAPAPPEFTLPDKIGE